MSARRVLITGANGYLGARIARRLAQESEAELLLWLHASDEASLAAKRERLAGELGPGSARFFAGDLRADAPFAALDGERPTHIVHAAAVTRFNVERELARAVNIEGTRKLLEFAGRCPDLEGLDFLGTVYSSGLRAGPIPEEPLGDECGFANHYEWSKWEAEQLVLARSPVPWRILRVCTIIADDERGSVGQQNAFHNTLKLLYYGLLSLVPGERSTPLYFVTADYVTRALQRLLGRAPDRAVYHASPDRSGALPLGRLIELAFERFQHSEDFRRRRLLPPLFTDLESFELLASGVASGMGGSVVGEAVQSVAPFARQMFVAKEIENRRLIEALGGRSPGHPEELLRAVCENLVNTRWGRKPALVPGAP